MENFESRFQRYLVFCTLGFDPWLQLRSDDALLEFTVLTLPEILFVFGDSL